MLRMVCVCGARPNFMKIAPLVEAFEKTGRMETLLVHTGQHYDDRMSGLFFQELEIPKPDINLDVGSASHAIQTAEVMRRFEPVLAHKRTDWVVVVGDVNSTLACALTACKLGVKVAHVEAGLRSFDRRMPEEINRLLTDAISDLLFVSEPSGLQNLEREGVAEQKVHFVGNVMIDTLMKHRARAEASGILATLDLVPKAYAVATLHRPSNVDDPTTLSSILDAFSRIGEEMPVVFPVHPRTRRNIDKAALGAKLDDVHGLLTPEPLGYLDFLKLMSDAAVVLTDSGGIQEETTILGVPCVTLRENTERPITITHGTNCLTPSRTDAILEACDGQMRRGSEGREPPPLWDGKAAERIARVFLDVTGPDR